MNRAKGPLEQASLKPAAKKILLVCSDPCEDVEQRLAQSGYKLTHADDGESAVARAQREMFDAAVLMSTGEKMDLLETAFNLKDIRRSMPIFLSGDACKPEVKQQTLLSNLLWCSRRDLEFAVRMLIS